MARTYARFTTAGLSDPGWCSLSMGAQWLYTTLLRQPKLTLVGTLDLFPGRWTTAANVSVKDAEKWLTELREAEYVVVDDGTGEVLIRTMFKHDMDPSRLSKPVVTGLWNQWRAVSSSTLRARIVTGMPEGVWTKIAPTAPAEAVRMREETAGHPHSNGNSGTHTEGEAAPHSSVIHPSSLQPTTPHQLSGDTHHPAGERPRDGGEQQQPSVGEAKPGTRPPSLPDEQTIRRTAVLVSKQIASTSAGVQDPTAYAARAAQRILNGDTDDDRNRITQALTAGQTPEQIAATWQPAPYDPLGGMSSTGTPTGAAYQPRPACTVDGCVNGMLEHPDGLVRRCHGCNGGTPNASTDRITPTDSRAPLSPQENLHDQCKYIA